jgi:anthranilate phosphoribosyltransferase
MGVRTIFNLLGPLTNPAGAPNQLIGVFSDQWLEPLAQVLARLGSRHVLVVHGEDGLDEISIGAPTQVAELKDGTVRRLTLTPGQFGLQCSPIDALVVKDAEASLALIEAVLADTLGAARDIVLLNAGAAIYAADLADTLEQGMDKARAVITEGAARRKLDELVKLTNEFK